MKLVLLSALAASAAAFAPSAVKQQTSALSATFENELGAQAPVRHLVVSRSRCMGFVLTLCSLLSYSLDTLILSSSQKENPRKDSTTFGKCAQHGSFKYQFVICDGLLSRTPLLFLQ